MLLQILKSVFIGELYDLVAKLDTVHLSGSESNFPVNIAGYVAFKLVHGKSLLPPMQNLLKSNVDLEYAYLFNIDRGDMRWLTDLQITEKSFLLLSKHKQILTSLLIKRFEFLGMVNGVCFCIISVDYIVNFFICTLTDVIQNNYSKRTVDRKSTKKFPEAARK